MSDDLTGTMSKRQLQIILQGLEEIQFPDPESEQYPIPANLAAEILNIALMRGDISGKTVLELGCGSGKLALGASLMGATRVIAVDNDPTAIEIAGRNVKSLRQHLQGRVDFVCCDVSEWRGETDTVIQNPPFGVQKKRADRNFLRKAMESAHRIYSLHRGDPRVRNFIVGFVESMGFNVEEIVPYELGIPHIFDFHRKKRLTLPVDLYIIIRS